MRNWKICAVALVLAVAVPSSLRAQTTPAVPAQASGIVGLVQMVAAKCKACKAKCCACPLGQMLTNAMQPANLFLGGLLCPPCCPPINPDDLNKSSTSPQGACAKVMQEEMDMPARRKAIKCLSRVDCHWWPEVEVALITGLRTDQNECVRLEAALALSNGCCCTKKIMEALLITVTGSKRDGNPSENSERVKAAALGALQHCVACYCDEDFEPQRPEKPPTGTKPPPLAELKNDPNRLAYYNRLDEHPSEEILANARRALAATAVVIPQTEVVRAPAGSRSLLQLWANAQNSGPYGEPVGVSPRSVAAGHYFEPVGVSPRSLGQMVPVVYPQLMRNP